MLDFANADEAEGLIKDQASRIKTAEAKVEAAESKVDFYELEIVEMNQTVSKDAKDGIREALGMDAEDDDDSSFHEDEDEYPEHEEGSGSVNGTTVAKSPSAHGSKKHFHQGRKKGKKYAAEINSDGEMIGPSTTSFSSTTRGSAAAMVASATGIAPVGAHGVDAEFADAIRKRAMVSHDPDDLETHDDVLYDDEDLADLGGSTVFNKFTSSMTNLGTTLGLADEEDSDQDGEYQGDGADEGSVQDGWSVGEDGEPRTKPKKRYAAERAARKKRKLKRVGLITAMTHKFGGLLLGAVDSLTDLAKSVGLDDDDNMRERDLKRLLKSQKAALKERNKAQDQLDELMQESPKQIIERVRQRKLDARYQLGNATEELKYAKSYLDNTLRANLEFCENTTLVFARTALQRLEDKHKTYLEEHDLAQRRYRRASNYYWKHYDGQAANFSKSGGEFDLRKQRVANLTEARENLTKRVEVAENDPDEGIKVLEKVVHKQYKVALGKMGSQRRWEEKMWGAQAECGFSPEQLQNPELLVFFHVDEVKLRKLDYKQRMLQRNVSFSCFSRNSYCSDADAVWFCCDLTAR